MKLFQPLLGFLALTMASSTNAHELWIDATDYQVAIDQNMVANIKVGENFAGSNFSFNPTQFVRFDVAMDNRLEPVKGRLGDRPAVDIEPLGEGLNILIHQSTVLDVYYREWEKFVSFVEHKDFAGALARHEERGLPKEEFREAYARFAKSLIGVGNSKGNDTAFGLETEVIALENPYTDDVTDGIDVKVVYRDMPRINAQVEVFEKSMQENAEVNVFTVRTNAEGVAKVPVKPGHIYQVDSVVLREDLSESAQEKEAVWETLWANLTFAVPQ